MASPSPSLARRALKPYYLSRPSLVIRRMGAERDLRRFPTGAVTTVSHVVGTQLDVRPADHAGSSCVRLGFYDLVVSEMSFRLADPGATVIDAGANIGTMTVVLAAAVGSGGTVHAFEPQQRALSLLEPNLARLASGRFGQVRLHRVALGPETGTAMFGRPVGDDNAGAARVVFDAADTQDEEQVHVARLDDLVSSASLMKIDIEGGELGALAGAPRLLGSGPDAVRDIIFEDFDAGSTGSSPLVDELRGLGFTVLSVHADLRGPRVDHEIRWSGDNYDPPSYLATRDATRARRLLSPRGWRFLHAAQ